MKNRLVPHPEWTRFFEDFTAEHEGDVATMRVLDPRFGAQVEAREMPFEGIAVDPDLRGPIRIQLGRRTPSNLEHPIDRPEQVWLEMTDEGAPAALAIVASDGRRTILELSGSTRGSSSGRPVPS